ncbi:hypothetical protein FJD05_22490 [Escherichia coli]|nr:hypothetical protein [Escherichia coli]
MILSKGTKQKMKKKLKKISFIISMAYLSGTHAAETSIPKVSGSAVNLSGVTMDSDKHNTVSNFGLVAIGDKNTSSSTHAITIGQENTASGPFSVAIGTKSVAGDSGAAAIGYKASAKNNGIAIGTDARSDDAAIAVGSSSKAAYSSVALGPSSFATGRASVSIGGDASGTGSVAIGGQAKASKEYSMALGKFSEATADNAFAQGYNAHSTSEHAISIGTSSLSTGSQSISLGAKASAEKTGSVSIGSFSSSVGKMATSVGYGATSGGAASVSVGNNSNAEGDGSSAIGFMAGAHEISSVALGTKTAAESARSTVLGSFSKATVEDGVALGSMSVADRAAGATDAWTPKGGIKDKSATWISTSGAVSLGGKYNGESKTRQITNVAAGSADSDAVNVAQLKQLDNSVSQQLTNITTNSKYFKANSSESEPVPGGKNSIAVGPVAQASANDSIAIGHNSTVSDKAPAGSIALGHRAKAERAHTGSYSINNAPAAGKTGKTTAVISVGSVNNERQIQNVAPGVVSETSTDAVNGSQLHSTNQQVSKNTSEINQIGNKFNQLNNRIDGLNKDIRGVGASAAAMSAIPQAYLPGKSLLGLGVGGYGGESAIALGVSTISDNGKVILKMNAGQNTRGNFSVGAGVGYQW